MTTTPMPTPPVRTSWPASPRRWATATETRSWLRRTGRSPRPRSGLRAPNRSPRPSATCAWTREYIAKAQRYSLPVPAETLGPVLKRCTESLSKADCEVLAQCFDAASEQTFDPYSEIGKSGGGDNADILTQVNAQAEELFGKSAEAGTGFTREQAVSKVFDMNPAAYDQYLADRRGR